MFFSIHEMGFFYDMTILLLLHYFPIFLKS